MRIFKTLCLVFSLFYSLLAYSQSVLQILPTRVVFEGNQRSVDVFLKNRGDNDGEYRVSLRNQRMTNEGKFEVIEKGQGGEDELFADKMIRYSPRRVTISKDINQEPQTVRLALRKKRDLPEGEYRSHLLFTSIPNIDKATEQSNGMSFFATVEISIPIIIRHGNLEAKVTLSDAKLTSNSKGENILSFRLNRSGTRSIYGDIVITQNAQRIAYMNGMAVYTPTKYRIIEVPVAITAKPNTSPITIQFKENPTYGGEEEAQLVLK